jgi:ferredoxin
VPADLEPLARRAVKSCPTLALLLEQVNPKPIAT